MRREELVMDILGELDDRLITEALPKGLLKDTKVETRRIIEIQPVGVSGKELRRYSVIHALGMAAAAVLIVGAVVLLIMNWDKIAVREPERPGVFTTADNDGEIGVNALPVTFEEMKDMISYGGKTLSLPCNPDDVLALDERLSVYYSSETGKNSFCIFKIDGESICSLTLAVGGTDIDIPEGKQLVTFAIRSGGDFSLFGGKIKLGTTLDEVKALLGEPRHNYEYPDYSYKFTDDGESIFINDMRFDDEGRLTQMPDISYIGAAADRLGQITDTSMPDPGISSMYGTYLDFTSPWKIKVSHILLGMSTSQGERGSEWYRENAWKTSNESILTPYGLYDSMDLVSFCRDLDIPWENIEECVRGWDGSVSYPAGTPKEEYEDIERFTEEELTALGNGDNEAIARLLASDYSIVVGENVFSPRWLYYHTTEDYKAAGIPADELYHKMFTYSELDITDEAWGAFKVKLSVYANSAYDADTFAVNIADNGYAFSEKAFGIFEDVFYGEWEPAEGNNAENNIVLTYTKDMFTFESWVYPFGILENDEYYVMPYMDSGVPECLAIRKDAPDVLYRGRWNRTDSAYSDHFADTVETFSVEREKGKYKRVNDTGYDRELHTGEIGVWGLLRLVSGGEESNIRPTFAAETYYTIPGGFYGGGYRIPGGFDGKGYFTDEDGTVWTISGTKALDPSKMYYLGGDGINSLTLGIRYYEKAAYETYVNEHINDEAYEPEERYFAVSFTVDENGICRTSYSPYEPGEMTEAKKAVRQTFDMKYYFKNDLGGMAAGYAPPFQNSAYDMYADGACWEWIGYADCKGFFTSSHDTFPNEIPDELVELLRGYADGDDLKPDLVGELKPITERYQIFSESEAYPSGDGITSYRIGYEPGSDFLITVGAVEDKILAFRENTKYTAARRVTELLWDNYNTSFEVFAVLDIDNGEREEYLLIVASESFSEPGDTYNALERVKSLLAGHDMLDDDLIMFMTPDRLRETWIPVEVTDAAGRLSGSMIRVADRVFRLAGAMDSNEYKKFLADNGVTEPDESNETVFCLGEAVTPHRDIFDILDIEVCDSFDMWHYSQITDDIIRSSALEIDNNKVWVYDKPLSMAVWRVVRLRMLQDLCPQIKKLDLVVGSEPDEYRIVIHADEADREPLMNDEAFELFYDPELMEFAD